MSGCLLVTTKSIDMPFGMWTRRGPMNCVLRGDWILPQKGVFYIWTCPQWPKVDILNLIRI